MNKGLPRCVYERRGKFYLVKKNRWIPLGPDKDKAIELAAEISGLEWRPEQSIVALEAYLAKAWKTAMNNAKGRRKKSFTITLHDVIGLGHSQRWRCAVTSTPFSLHRDPDCNRSPLAPSIDRINNLHGYHAWNARLVCVAANYAMNQWGAAPLRVMMAHMRRRQF